VEKAAGERTRLYTLAGLWAGRLAIPDAAGGEGGYGVTKSGNYMVLTTNYPSVLSWDGVRLGWFHTTC